MRAATLLITIFVAGIVLASGQKLPDKIDGYKVQKGRIFVRAETDNSAMPEKADAVILVGQPTLVDMGFSGITLEAPMRFAAINRSGTAERIAFHDLRVNGVAIEAEHKGEPFSFAKGKPFELPVRPRVFVKNTSIVIAAYKELTASSPKWRVTGTAFLFGKFNKFGMTFKRVIPVALDIEIPNPISR